jgi:hypothetical protein
MLLQTTDLFAKVLGFKLSGAQVEEIDDAPLTFSGVNFAEELVDVSEGVVVEDCAVVVSVGD